MNKDKDDMRNEYRREDLGEGVRGKYFKWVEKDSNLILPGEEVAKALPGAEAVSASDLVEYERTSNFIDKLLKI